MSKNRRNNHYHYAEKFEDRRRNSSMSQRAFVPFKSVVISLVVLLMFGLVSTTFATYISDDSSMKNPEAHPIISEVRNIKNTRDIAMTGADADLASTGGNVSGGTVVVEVPSSWTSYSHIQFGLYQNGFLWCSDDMTRIANTNFYYGSNPNHGSWSNEQIMFMANNSHFGEGSFDGTNSAKYSGKITQAMSSNYYTFWLSGSSNAYTNTYKGNYDSLANAIYVFNQTANIYTKTTASGGYTSSGTGGNVEITARYLNGNSATESTTPSSNGNTSVTYERAVNHTSVTFKATANSGYRFVGWYSSTTATSATSSSESYTISSLSGTNTLYARFIKRVTVTAAKSPSGYTGTAPTVGGSSSSTVDIGSSVTLDANVTQGITAVWKSGSSSGTTVLNTSTGSYTPSANVTLYACYTLTAPTFTSYSYTSDITVGSASTLDKTVSSATGSTSGLRYTYSAAAYGVTVNDSSVTSSTWSFDSSGNFTPTIPGQYKITVSVYDTAKGLTSATVSKNTAIVNVKPTTPTRIEFAYDPSYDGSGTYADPFMVPVNDTGFYINPYIPIADRDSNYTYSWTRTDGTYVLSTGAITSSGHSATDADATGLGVTDTASSVATNVIHNAMLGSTDGYIYKVSVARIRNGVSSEAYPYTFYYNVTNNFLRVEEFDFKSFNADEPVQKIYAEDNNINKIDADYDAGGSTFKTMLWYSNDNISWNEVAAWFPNTFQILSGATPNPNPSQSYSALPNDSAHRVSTLQRAISTIARNNVNLMGVAGPKWFRGYVADENDNYANPSLHTTVGSASTIADRPVYYVDATANQANTDGCRVMAFYILEGSNTVHYQTAQAVGGRSNTYRFYIPSDTVKITFAHVATSNYVLPTYNSDSGNLTYSYGSTVLKAWTPTLDLTSGDNAGKTTYKADTPGTPVNGIYYYTNTSNGGNMITLD